MFGTWPSGFSFVIAYVAKGHSEALLPAKVSAFPKQFGTLKAAFVHKYLRVCVCTPVLV